MTTHRHLVVAPFTLLLVACQLGTTSNLGTEPDPDPGPGGLGMPDGCYEDHREVVADPAVAPEGFDRPALEVIADLEGEYVGTGVDLDGGEHDLSLRVAWDGGAIEAVYLVYRSAPDGSMAAEGPPDDASTCLPRYAYGVTTALDVPDLVAADGAGRVGDATPETAFWAETPLEAVDTELAPSFDPADWDRTSLTVSFAAWEDQTRVEVMWSGANDRQDPEPAANGNGNGNGTVSTGVVEPEGILEFVLGADVTRVP